MSDGGTVLFMVGDLADNFAGEVSGEYGDDSGVVWDGVISSSGTEAHFAWIVPDGFRGGVVD